MNYIVNIWNLVSLWVNFIITTQLLSNGFFNKVKKEHDCGHTVCCCYCCHILLFTDQVIVLGACGNEQLKRNNWKKFLKISQLYHRHRYWVHHVLRAYAILMGHFKILNDQQEGCTVQYMHMNFSKYSGICRR